MLHAAEYPESTPAGKQVVVSDVYNFDVERLMY